MWIPSYPAHVGATQPGSSGVRLRRLSPGPGLAGHTPREAANPADNGGVLGFSGLVAPEPKASTPDWWMIVGGSMVEEARMEGSQALGDGESTHVPP